MSGLSIIIPVFNAYDHLQACLVALTQTVPSNTRILLIDDASTDERVIPLIQSWVSKAVPFRKLLIQEQNRGFVATVNHGMRQADSDVVLLNSDTEVAGDWLERLSVCLGSDPLIATATPWSNNGEIVSIPQFCAANQAPDNPESVAATIAASGRPQYPDMPTAVGFCMAISKRAIEQIGLFDEKTFGLGYGEENDFCQRAQQVGMRNVLCDDAYVIHHGSASFGPLGIRPDESSMQRLLTKHPGYQDQVTDFIQQDPLAQRRQVILAAIERVAGRML
jgi:GT2 family glycosyltransferase